MHRIDAEERAHHIDTVAHGMAPHAAKTGKTRSAPEAHHHRFGLIAGVMAEKKASALAAHAFQQQPVARVSRPGLKPGGGRRGPDRQDFGRDPAPPHPLTDAGRLGGAAGPDAMVDDERRVAMPVPPGKRVGKQRQGAAVRPSRKGGEERLPACQPAEKAVFESCREPIAGRCCVGSVSHRSWRPRSVRQGALSGARKALGRRLAAAGRCRRPAPAARNATRTRRPRSWCR